jgi:hypothetical protein
MTRLTLIFLTSVVVPWHLCDAEDGTVTGDTRYKYSQRDKVSERPAESTKVVQTANTRKTHRVAPRRWHIGAHWYYLHAGELPWWPNAPGD